MNTIIKLFAPGTLVTYKFEISSKYRNYYIIINEASSTVYKVYSLRELKITHAFKTLLIEYKK